MTEQRPTLLLADDDPGIRRSLRLFLEGNGFSILEAGDGLEAEEIFAAGKVALALLDLKMPRRTGLEFLRNQQERLEETPVIVITAFGGSAAAIEAMKRGAFDYITKPFDLDEVLFTVRRALMQKTLVDQVQAMSAEALEDIGEEELVGRTPAMLAVFKTIGRVAATSATVLISGESGTGKELVAAAIHNNSDRAEKPFVKVNCAALSAPLLESELFGHERGAFTGAVARRIGRFEFARDGTLFLDEIGDMELDLQAKLLRVLQTGQFERVGSNESIQTGARIIAASNQNLPVLIVAGRFRQDLYYRLNVVAIHLPPLRERRDDIPLLAEYIVQRLTKKHGWPQLGLTAEAVQVLKDQSWPGNVRQLRNVLARAAILARGRLIQAEDVRTEPEPNLPSPPSTLVLKDILAETERRVIRQALEQENWNRTKAARVLGISRRQLFEKIRQYGWQP